MQCKLVSAILLLGLLDTLAVQVYSQPQTANTTYYITLGDRVLPNNSYVLISDIGSDVSAGLQCHHDLDNDTQAGSWYSPYNYKVSTYRYNAIYTETFEDGVALVRHEVRPVYRVQQGIYRCQFTDDSAESVFVGLYRDTSTELYISSPMKVSVDTTDTLQFTVICTSRGGPVTEVTWMRDSEVIEGGSSVVTNSRYSEYTHYLNDTEEGIYECILSNNKPSTVNDSLNLTVPEPPSNLSLIQTQLTAVTVSWTASPQPGVRYIVLYQLLEPSPSPRQKTSVLSRTQLTLNGLVSGGTYSISVVSVDDLFSIEVDPINITLATIDDMVSIEVNRDGPFYVGTSLNISCVLTIPETVDPDIVRDVRIAKAGSSYSTYSTHFNSLEYSNEGNYYCRVCFSRRDYYYYYRGNCESTTEQFFLDVEKIPPPKVRLLLTGIPEAGGAVTLNCTVSLTPYLAVSPTVEILGPGEVLLASEETDTYLSYTIDPVMTWDAGLYICRANLKVLNNRGSVELDEDSKNAHGLSIQLPQPIVSITASSPGYVFLHGSSVTLTCEATLSPVVDRYASVSLVWGGPRLQLGETAYTVIESGSGLHYTSSLTLSRVRKTDDGDYTCTVRVAGEGNIIGSVVTQSFPFFVKYYG